MRHWNPKAAFTTQGWCWVFTLPMRHWNGRQPTAGLNGRSRVFTLPMRHWNCLSQRMRETTSSVFTLPMRHWNFNLMASSIYLRSVFTLPMRHWNFFPILRAWSLIVVFTLPMRHWNSICFSSWVFYFESFYPTYEALKLEPPDKISISPTEFLPYLWGIETDASMLPRYHEYGFLPYLWGIETSIILKWMFRISYCFYPTYEALKLLFFFRNLHFLYIVFTLPIR